MLEEDEREPHRKFCRENPSIPLFLNDWWLDAVCGKDWGAVVYEQDDEIIATLPYFLTRRNGFKVIAMPQLTQSMGPWMKYPNTKKKASKIAFEKKTMNELIKQLPRCSYFSQTFHYSLDYWAPFYWKGFKETTRYTYVLSDLSNLDEIRSGLQRDIQRAIRDSEKQGILVESSEDVHLLYQICSLTFGRQGLNTPFQFELLRKIDSEASSRQCRRILFSRDAQGKIYSTVYIVWDENTVHYLLGGTDPVYRDSGAGSLAIWNAIQYTSEIGKTFNFEGSVIEPVEQYFRAFGGEPKPYFHITKTTSKILRLFNALRAH